VCVAIKITVIILVNRTRAGVARRHNVGEGYRLELERRINGLFPAFAELGCFGVRRIERIVLHDGMIHRHAVFVGTKVSSRLIGVLEVAHLEVEFAVGRNLFRAHAGAFGRQSGWQDRRLPGRWTAVRAIHGAVVCGHGAAVEWIARFIVLPLGAGRFSKNRRIQADLLERRRTVVVVREGEAQAAIDTVNIDDRIDQDALDHRSCSEVQILHCLRVRRLAEIRVRHRSEMI